MFEKAKLKWRSQTTTDRLYTIAIVFSCTGYASTFFFRGNFLFFGIALTISSSLFVIGFFRWIWAWLGDKWKTKLGKFIISALSAAIWFLAIILSRIFVSKALGLPPQDFETTVYIVAFWLYPALWFLLLSVTMLIISLMFILLGFSCAIASTITDSPIFRIPFIFPQNLYPQWITSIQIRTRTFIETVKNKFMLRFIGHAIGATIICFAAAQAWNWNTNFLTTNATFIKWVAYGTDFQYAAKYPGIDSNKRLRLHENGVVSYAERDGWDIKITVDKVHN